MIYPLAEIKGPDDVLQVSEYGLLRISSLSSVEADKLSNAAAASLLNPGFMTVLEAERLEEKWRRLSTGCHVIDQTIGGGFPVRGITELAGESGCGKTQLCLQLCLSVQFPKQEAGLDAGSVLEMALSLCLSPLQRCLRLVSILYRSCIYLYGRFIPSKKVAAAFPYSSNKEKF